MKKAIGWILLIVLLALMAGVSYIKFMYKPTEDITETPTNTETSQVIITALNEIVDNFNEDTKIEEYETNGTKINATYNENSNTIFVTYEDDETITYEFAYDNLNLIANISNDEKNLEKFKKVEEILIYAIQKRLNNEENIKEDVDAYLAGTKELEMIKTLDTDTTTTYTINITKKIGENLTETQAEEQEETTKDNNENTETTEDTEKVEEIEEE